MALAIGAGIPAPSEVIDVCFGKHQSTSEEGMGIPAPPQGRRPEDIGQRADERKPLFAQANYDLRAKSEAVVCASKLRAKSDLRMVRRVRFRSNEHSDVARK